MVQLSKHGVMSIFQNPKDISPHPSQKFKRICIFCWDHLFPLAVGAPRITSPLYALPSPPSRSTILYYILYSLTCCTHPTWIVRGLSPPNFPSPLRQYSPFGGIALTRFDPLRRPPVVCARPADPSATSPALLSRVERGTPTVADIERRSQAFVCPIHL